MIKSTKGQLASLFVCLIVGLALCAVRQGLGV